MNADEKTSELREATRERLNAITEKVIGCSHCVSNILGSGFLEKVYENALAHELRRHGMRADQQVRIDVWYDDILAGEYVADIVVEGQVLIELKSSESLVGEHVSQCLNYLHATGLRVCLLLNFGTRRIQVKRLVHNF